MTEENLPQCLIEQFGLFRDAVHQHFEGCCRLSHGQLVLIQCIIQLSEGREDGIKASAIGKELGLSQPSITQMINRMEDAGYVIRRSDPSDRRVVLISATPAGVQEYERFSTFGKQMMEDLVEYLTPDRAMQLFTLLSEAIKYFNEWEGKRKLL